LECMSKRVQTRVAFGSSIADHVVVQKWIAEMSTEIEHARMLTLKVAHMMDTVGNIEAKTDNAMIKVIAPNVATRVIDRAIQAFGGAGVSDDFPIASFWANARTLRIADGPDEVHNRQIARLELKKYK